MTRPPVVREMLVGALVALAFVHVVQLPATATGSMMFLSGELTFGPFGRSDPALRGTDAAQRIEQRPSVAGRERLSVYVALRRIDTRDVALAPSSALNPNVLRAVSRVTVLPAPVTMSERTVDRIADRCSDAFPGIDAQIQWRIVLPRRQIPFEALLPRRPELVAFHHDGEEWIVERSCFDAR